MSNDTGSIKMALLIFLFLNFLLLNDARAELITHRIVTNPNPIKQKIQNTVKTAHADWQKIETGQRVVGQRTGWFSVGTECVDGSPESSESFVKKPAMPSYPNYRYSNENCYTVSVDIGKGWGYTHYAMRCCYKSEYYTTSDITEPIYALQLRIPLNRAIDPAKSSVMYVSGHLEYKDASGIVRTYHPTLTRTENNALVFEVPVDPTKGQIVAYPKVEYRVTEFK